jgi:multiple sugar transport system ATP-binding protein
MASVSLEHVEKVYPNGFIASRDLTLDIADGEFLVLVGPSGSGKSTVLRMIAGLETPTRGSIHIDDRDVTHLPPQERDVAMVFQSYALYPHMTVRENMAFGLRLRKHPNAEVKRRVSEVAESLGLAALLDRKPAQLSGGQRQRVALGRAIVREPCAFLFDEPLSNLDAKLRVETRAELSRLHRRLGATMIYVTHDQVEAMTLGDRVAVLRDGILQQVAPPMELYHAPANQFVAGFIGSPAMNFIEGALRREDGTCVFSATALTLPLPCGSGNSATEAVLGVRPQHLSVGAAGERGPGVVQATVAVVEPLGNEQVVHATTPSGDRLVIIAPPEQRIAPDESVTIRIPADRAYLFRKSDGVRLAATSPRHRIA